MKFITQDGTEVVGTPEELHAFLDIMNRKEAEPKSEPRIVNGGVVSLPGVSGAFTSVEYGGISKGTGSYAARDAAAVTRALERRIDDVWARNKARFDFLTLEAKARTDVAKLSQSANMVRGELFAPGITDTVEFIVQPSGVVIALLKYKRSGKVWSKGVAKCAPDDTFSPDIGKAIALRRALCVPVPAAYKHAPKVGGLSLSV